MHLRDFISDSDIQSMNDNWKPTWQLLPTVLLKRSKPQRAFTNNLLQ